MATWARTPATAEVGGTEGKREEGRSQNNRDMFYMAHFPQMLGTAALANQGLPLAMLQAGFEPDECAAQMMPKTP